MGNIGMFLHLILTENWANNISDSCNNVNNPVPQTFTEHSEYVKLSVAQSLSHGESLSVR